MAFSTLTKDFDGSPTFSVSKTAASATRQLRMDWPDINTAIEDLFGLVFVAGTGVVRGDIHTFPGKPWLLLDSMDIVPFDKANPQTFDANGMPTFKKALATLKYKTVPWDQDDDSNEDDPDTPEGTYLTHRISLGGDMLTLSESGLEWENNNDDGKKDVAADVAPGMLIPTREHQFTWHFVPSPPWDAMRDAYGKLNTNLQYGAAAETLMFLGADAERDVTIDGARAWTLDYRFQERALKAGGIVVGWNHFFRPDPAAADNSWQKIKRKDGLFVYETTDFDPLFQFAAGAA